MMVMVLVLVESKCVKVTLIGICTCNNKDDESRSHPPKQHPIVSRVPHLSRER